MAAVVEKTPAVIEIAIVRRMAEWDKTVSSGLSFFAYYSQTMAAINAMASAVFQTSLAAMTAHVLSCLF